MQTDYVDGIQYEGGVLQFVQTEEGRVRYNGGNWKYEYYLADHLGNSRASFDQTNGSIAKQRDDYYPFGLDITVGNYPTDKNQYLYNKKEL